MMGVATEQDAAQAGSAARARLTMQGWILRTWENDGWHWSLENHLVSLRKRQHDKKFWVLVTDDPAHVGSGAMLFSDPDHRGFEHEDPNVAVGLAIGYAEAVVTTLVTLIADMKRQMSGDQDARREQLLELLVQIDAEGDPLERTGAVIRVKRGYLSGRPHLISSFYDRAFVFRNVQQAEEVVMLFKDILELAVVQGA